MAIDKNTPFGGITISSQAIESVANDAALNCYGVVALTHKKKSTHTLDQLLKRDPKEQVGAIAKKTSDGWVVDIFIIVAYGIKITEIIGGVQEQIKYVLEKKFDLKFKAINVYVEGVKVIL